MKKLHSLFALLFVLLVVFLFYASIWGENKKIAVVVENFFNAIQEQNYQLACEKLGTNNLCKVSAKNENNSINAFALELCLLKHFRLLDSASYTVKIKKNKMWFPYISTDSVSVDLQLKGADDAGFDFSPAKLVTLFQRNEGAFLEKFLHVKRVDGRWRIDGFDIKSANILADYNKILQEIDLAEYITVKANSITLHEINLDTIEMSLEKKRVVLYVLAEFENIVRNKKKTLLSASSLSPAPAGN